MMNLNNSVDISVVIPVYNSEENLTPLTIKIQEALNDISFEIIYINDFSKDNSWAVIAKLGAKYEFVKGLSLIRNSGQDNAIIAGLNHARGKYIVIMDDDLQHNPADIFTLYQKCKEGAQVCYANFNTKKQAAWKNLGSWLNGKVAEFLINKPKGIYLSPFLIMKREVVDELVKYKGPFPYIQGLIFNITNNVTQVNIEHHKRYKGESNYNLVKSISLFLRLATGYSVKPLRVATFTGIVSSVLGFLLIPYYLYEYFFSTYKVEGFTTIIILMLIFGGLILLSLGLIGEYIGRLYINVNNKPQYVVYKKINY
jgi:undecaprenyl-phosphate 4-deoxy-4-formamido-L-arabinose transferase